MLETIFSGNYTFGFLTSRSNNLLHLTHWQYWFWFFFTWFIVLYYIIFINFFFKRSQAYNMKISTSFRSHGKWGDFIVCVVPISWCLNILTNSNFILRLVEWQSESSMFSLRVRGKQWYWVYKIDITNLTNIPNASKQIGLSSWTTQNNTTNYSYLELLRLQNSFTSQQDLWQKSMTLSNSTTNQTNNSLNSFTSQPFFNESVKSLPFMSLTNTKHPYTLYTTFISTTSSSTVPSSLGGFANSYTDFDTKFTSSRNKTHTRLGSYELVANTTPAYKQFTKNSFFIIKQKRFSYKSIGASSHLNSNHSFSQTIETKSLTKLLFTDFSKNYTLNKRLLRTFKLLVLPVNVNISVITNSFDVIHSWFIPGLGLKLDCVPGRSTHHTLHIVNPGFYYGQCAEICGRYHHHMPIRVCALNYTHFVFWWNNRGSHQFLQSHKHLQL